jgi:serine phosphatase RsbU (regulator of sigma subunit)
MGAAIMRAMHGSHVPSEVLSVANDVASRQGDGGSVTGIVAVVDDHAQTLTFANAGHPPPLLCTGNRHAFFAHEPADLPLGIFPHYRAVDYVVALPPDALVVFYTDSITEHDHDPIGGASELVEAARLVHDWPCRLERNIATVSLT